MCVHFVFGKGLFIFQNKQIGCFVFVSTYYLLIQMKLQISHLKVGTTFFIRPQKLTKTNKLSISIVYDEKKPTFKADSQDGNRRKITLTFITLAQSRFLGIKKHRELETVVKWLIKTYSNVSILEPRCL